MQKLLLLLCFSPVFVQFTYGHGLLGGLGLCGPPQPMCPPPPMCPPALPPLPCPPPMPPCPPCMPTFCPPPVICPPPIICAPPPPPCPPQLPCTCAAPAPFFAGPQMGGGYPIGGMAQPPQPFIPSNDCCCGCASPCSFRAAFAKVHGARIFSAPNAGEDDAEEEEDPTCNNEKLRQAINEHITSDPSESKRAIQKAAEAKLFAKINVICANGEFSYVAYTDAYCQATSGSVTCYAFRPLGVEKA
ncbi:hypothetical protein niasHS_006447 [Heterodera schachtii]|uniref:Ground-like domain-containing protein n=1 Tax=Heterodera schachtii TaxID=97005 RepID=A0ABD2JHD7_HETSC